MSKVNALLPYGNISLFSIQNKGTMFPFGNTRSRQSDISRHYSKYIFKLLLFSHGSAKQVSPRTTASFPGFSYSICYPSGRSSLESDVMSGSEAVVVFLGSLLEATNAVFE